jgi:hypothetical protein
MIVAVYLVTPVLRIKYAGLVSGFLDRAARAGVRHVTYLSTYGRTRHRRRSTSGPSAKRSITA